MNETEYWRPVRGYIGFYEGSIHDGEGGQHERVD